VYGGPQLVANKANRLVAFLAILLPNCRHNQYLMIVKYFCTEGKRDTVPSNVGGIFFGVELNFHRPLLCYLHSFVNLRSTGVAR
jgi:hypothetical protein